MKEIENDKENLVRRKRSKHGRIRNPDSGCSWLCRTATDNPKASRGKANAAGSHQVGTHHNGQLLTEAGSVTAEFAIVLPGVLLILYFALSVMSIQMSRMMLVELAAEGSRAIARGEDQEIVSLLAADSGIKRMPSHKISYLDSKVCLEVTQIYEISGFGGLFPIELSESQCARKGGL